MDAPAREWHWMIGAMLVVVVDAGFDPSHWLVADNEASAQDADSPASGSLQGAQEYAGHEQCMYAKGNQVPGFAWGSAVPPPPPPPVPPAAAPR